MNLPYDKIKQILHEGNHEIDFIDKEGKKHVFKSFELPVDVIEDHLNDYMKAA